MIDFWFKSILHISYQTCDINFSFDQNCFYVFSWVVNLNCDCVYHIGSCKFCKRNLLIKFNFLLFELNSNSVIWILKFLSFCVFRHETFKHDFDFSIGELGEPRMKILILNKGLSRLLVSSYFIFDVHAVSGDSNKHRLSENIFGKIDELVSPKDWFR